MAAMSPAGMSATSCLVSRAAVRRLPSLSLSAARRGNQTATSTSRSSLQSLKPQQSSVQAKVLGLGNSGLTSGLRSGLHLKKKRKQQQGSVIVKAAAVGSISGSKPKQPALWERALSAFFYIIPWIDVLDAGEYFCCKFKTFYWMLDVPDPFVDIYYAHEFMPLIVFFGLFLGVARNLRFPHFVRFHCMQSIMLDISCMLFTIIRSYFPTELLWTPILNAYQSLHFLCVMIPVMYCVFYSLKGCYADIPVMSESVYLQIEASEGSPEEGE